VSGPQTSVAGPAAGGSLWIPAAERGRVQGIFFMGAHLSGGLTPMLVAAPLPLLGWRGVFVAFGMPGFVWVAAWLHWFRDRPSEHMRVSPAAKKT